MLTGGLVNGTNTYNETPVYSISNVKILTYKFDGLEFSFGDSSGVEAELLLFLTDLSLSGGVIGDEKEGRFFFTGESEENESEDRLFTAGVKSETNIT